MKGNITKSFCQSSKSRVVIITVAIVVIILVIVSAPVVREKFNAFMAKRKVKEAV